MIDVGTGGEPVNHELFQKGKALFLDYTSGIPDPSFNERSVDPHFIFDLAIEGEYSGLIVNPGVAEQYWRGSYRDINIIIQLDALLGEEITQICSVERAVKLGAAGVAVTLGTPEGLTRLGLLAESVRDHNLAIIVRVTGARSVRAALELGADIIIIEPGDSQRAGGDLSWLLRLSGRSDLLLLSNERDANTLLEEAYASNEAAGLVVGLNVAEHEKPFSLSKALGEVVYRRKRPEQVAHLLQNV